MISVSTIEKKNYQIIKQEFERNELKNQMTTPIWRGISLVGSWVDKLGGKYLDVHPYIYY